MIKITFLFLFLPFFSFAQNDSLNLHFDSSTQKITYSEVVKIDSVSAEDLLSRAKITLTNLFVSGKDVTQIIDENAKQIVGKGFLVPVISNGLMKMAAGKVWFTLTIQCREGRYKYTLTNFEHEGNPGTMWPQSNGPIESFNNHVLTRAQYQRLRDYIYNDIKNFIPKMKSEMANSSNSNSKNW